ncbi:MAG: preprotein translocase subunit YajC [Myxococcota bacterium]
MLLSFLTAAPLLAEGAPSTGSSLGGLLPIVLMFAVIYFIVLRPMSKQEKDRRKRVEGLQKGDKVVLQGGILGRVTNAEDPKIAVVEIADKVRVRVLKKDINDTQAEALKDDKNDKSKDDKSKDAKSKKDDARKGA